MPSKIPFDICGFYEAARGTVHNNRPGTEFSPRALRKLNKFGGVQTNRGGEWPPTAVEERCGSCALAFFAKLTDGRVKQSGISGQCQTNQKAAERAAAVEAENTAKAGQAAEKATRKAAQSAAELAIAEAVAATEPMARQLLQEMTAETLPPSMPDTEQGSA